MHRALCRPQWIRLGLILASPWALSQARTLTAGSNQCLSEPDPSALQELVEWVLEEVSQRAYADPLVLEVGCGSGAISLSLLSQLPQVSEHPVFPPFGLPSLCACWEHLQLIVVSVSNSVFLYLTTEKKVRSSHFLLEEGWRRVWL